MLTLLVRYKVSRRECLSAAQSVEFIPADKAEEGESPGLLVIREDGSAEHLGMTDKDDPNFRDVFVMNANGQTVARYTL